MNNFRVALIGYGLGGREFHAPFVSATDGLELAAIVSRRKEEIAARYPTVTALSDPAAVFADPNIDLVVISTPNDSHFDLAARALEAGKHVVLDKPFARTSQEARILIAKAKGRLLSVFHNRRWDADFLTLKKLIAEEALGELAYVESHFDLYRPTVTERWREQAGPATGSWFDLGSHLIDQVVQLFGKPQALAADLACIRPGAQTTDYFRVLLRYGTLRVVLVGNYLAQSDVRWIVHGSRASFLKNGLDTQQVALHTGVKPTDAAYGVDPHPGRLVLPGGQEVQVQQQHGNYLRFYEGIRDCLYGLSPVPVAASEALGVMELLELAEVSAAQHRELDVP